MIAQRNPPPPAAPLPPPPGEAVHIDSFLYILIIIAFFIGLKKAKKQMREIHGK